MKFAFMLTAFTLLMIPVTGQAVAADTTVTLTKIMSDPDWIGNPPEGAYWSDNSKAVYFSQKRDGSNLKDLYRVDISTGRTEKITDAEMSDISTPGGSFNRTHSMKIYSLHGDIFLRNLADNRVRQLTRTSETESDPFFLADGRRIAWRTGNTFYVYDPNSGLLSQPADIRLTKNPDDRRKPQTYLENEQLRLFDALRDKRNGAQAKAEQLNMLRAQDHSRTAAPFYLGDKIRIDNASLSPDAKWLVLITEPAGYDKGPNDEMPNYVNDRGYVESTKVHTHVGINPPAPQQVMLLNLKTHTVWPLDLTQLPGIKQDPLAQLRKSAVKWHVDHGMSKAQAEKITAAPDIRPVRVWNLAWSRNGRQLAIQFRAIDNKDRWITTVDFANRKLVTKNRLTDNAWINWDYNEFGWLPDNKTLWYLSERSGYSQLYITSVDSSRTRQLTHGTYEVSNPISSPDGHYLYVTANRTAPGSYEIYRVDTSSGQMQQITRLGGLNGAQPSMHENESYRLSPDGTHLLVYHSTISRPPQVYVTAARPGVTAKQLTHTTKPAYLAINWVVPKIVKIPSNHTKKPIYARLYVPQNYDPGHTYPAVFFVHGAGYLQDAHSGWSYYFHEFMFHTLLIRHGYIVIDMDYRGSAGYGRNWRTAIYRHMGHPELEDLEDGANWLVRTMHVDRKHVGIYGGSYGGFLTYMAMFRKPDLFAAGAALRPVGNWADYNHFYTADILNTPAVDPQAYDDSSPIHFVAGLQHPLLICQGMQDDNVFFMDTVHIVQRLLELKKPNFEVMFYPLEHHAFKAPIAWLDEYRRIFRLFQTYVNTKTAIKTKSD